MYVDPDTRAVLAAADPDAKDFYELGPHGARQAMDAMVAGMLEPVDGVSTTDLSVPGGAAARQARLYTPDGVPPLGLLVYFHGGGWVIGSLDNTDRPVRRLALESGLAVLSVDYRLAPEDPFPAGLDDCYAAAEWAVAHRHELGGASFIAVGGDSAGGNLAAAVTQLSRDRGDWTVDHQLLIYPVVTPDFDTGSYRQFANGYFLTRRTMQWFWDQYIGSVPAPAYADLLAGGSLSGLAGATIITCGLDPLCSEGQLYATRLAEAGVPVSHLHVEGLLHGAWFMDGLGVRAYQLGWDIAFALRRAAQRPPRQQGGHDA